MENTQGKLLVEFKDVSFAYDEKLVLDQVNFQVRETDFLGIIGPNGGGKTTLIKLLLRLVKPSNGAVLYEDKSVSLGYLPQYTNIDKSFPLTVLDVVLSGLMQKKKLFKRYGKQDVEKARTALTRIGVDSLFNKHIGSLSGGQIQKVLLARAIVANPDILILDEPETYVDYSSEGEMYELLKELNQNMAILVVSHDIGLISSYVKNIVCVNRKLYYHQSNMITAEQLAVYNCPVQLIAHGNVPHTVLKNHDTK